MHIKEYQVWMKNEVVQPDIMVVSLPVFKFKATTLVSKTLSEMNRGADNECKSQWESASPLL